MAISGNWTGHYSWGCTSNYGQFSLSFNPSGTFGGTFSGKWVQQDGTLLLSFDSGPARYGGTIDGNVGSGAMSTFAGSNGCWYLTKEGTSGIVAQPSAAHQQKQAHDAAGNPV